MEQFRGRMKSSALWGKSERVSVFCGETWEDWFAQREGRARAPETFLTYQSDTKTEKNSVCGVVDNWGDLSLLLVSFRSRFVSRSSLSLKFAAAFSITIIIVGRRWFLLPSLQPAPALHLLACIFCCSLLLLVLWKRALWKMTECGAAVKREEGRGRSSRI